MQTPSRKQTERWLAEKEIKAQRVLDIGASSFPIVTRVKSFDVGEYVTLDIQRQVRNKLGPSYEVDIQWDMNDPIEIHEEHGVFDVVFALKLLNYVYNPTVAFENIRSAMYPGSTLYIDFPFLYPQMKKGMDFMRYTRKSAEWFLVENGFVVNEITPITSGDPEALEKFIISETGASYLPNETGYLVQATAI